MAGRWCTDGSLLHLGLEMTITLLVIFASHGVLPVTAYAQDCMSPLTGFVVLLSFCLACLGVFCLRYLEIGLLHPREASRRTAGAWRIKYKV